MLDCTTNVFGTLNYLEACRHNAVPRFVFASSGAPIGECKPPIHEELAAHPVSPYGASKLAGEAYCSAYARSFGIETVALRFGNCYGPLSNHKSSVVAKFVRDACRPCVEIYGDGHQTRDFIFVEDIVEAIMWPRPSATRAARCFRSQATRKRLCSSSRTGFPPCSAGSTSLRRQSATPAAGRVT